MHDGLPGRPWFKHAVYAPGLTTGYAAWPLPAIRQALEDDKTPDAKLAAEVERTVERIKKATAALEAARNARRVNASDGSQLTPWSSDRPLPGARWMSLIDSDQPPRGDSCRACWGRSTRSAWSSAARSARGSSWCRRRSPSDVPFLSGIILVWVIGGIFSGAGR